MCNVSLEIKKINKDLAQPLKEFFYCLIEEGVISYFHPHPFTEIEADKIADYQGTDKYYVMIEGEIIIGYGMLRGWDDGFEIPSLGIVINPLFRGLGLGRLFLNFLHFVAWRSGAKKVMLKVYPDNVTALRLYQKMGYSFQPGCNDQLIGYLDIKKLFNRK